MADFPLKLQETLDDFSFVSSREDRADFLIEIADRFDSAKVPENVATQPYDEAHRVKACESEAFVWAVDQPDGTLKYWFDVLNPQGLSAMAVSVILDESCSNVPLEQVASIRSDIIFDLFGKDVSMGKGQGLMGIVDMVVYEAKKRLR